jgi:hypothetical protein
MAAATAAPYYPSPFVTALLVTLGPYFSAHKPQNDEHPFTDIVRTLSDYGARTRVEMLHAAQALAFGFSALETLAEARSNPELTPTLLIRFRACANALHKAALASEKFLRARLSCDTPTTAGRPKPDAPETPEEPEATALKALQQAKARIDAHRARLTPTPAQRRESALSHLFQQPEPSGPPPIG